METSETSEYPLISAILLAGRVQLEDILNSIECFKAQTYPNKELIIVNNVESQYAASALEIPATPHIFLIDTPLKLSAGKARNFGMAAASGSIIAQFDADYWFAPSRLSAQVATMANEKAHISVLADTLHYSFNSGCARLHTTPQNAVLGTMVFSRSPQIDYPDVEHNEEFGILQKMIRANMRPIAMVKPELACKLVLTKNKRRTDAINRGLEPEQFELVQHHINSRVVLPCSDVS